MLTSSETRTLEILLDLFVGQETVDKAKVIERDWPIIPLVTILISRAIVLIWRPRPFRQNTNARLVHERVSVKQRVRSVAQPRKGGASRDGSGPRRLASIRCHGKPDCQTDSDAHNDRNQLRQKGEASDVVQYLHGAKLGRKERPPVNILSGRVWDERSNCRNMSHRLNMRPTESPAASCQLSTSSKPYLTRRHGLQDITCSDPR